ncbi:MAG: hydrolase [Deltaproteobacteria bacterium]|nr:hydrolase [Deltaproteobacteria bacterium]
MRKDITLPENNNTGILIIDAQEKLMPAVHQAERIVGNIIKLLHLSVLYKFPIILTEQNPEKIGTTLPEIKGILPVYDPIPKVHFNCCDMEIFNRRLSSSRLKKIIVTGVETHICVFQTALSLLERGYRVEVPQDAVGSRTEENRHVGLNLMKEAGAVITSAETIIYQILRQAGTAQFREMLKVVK